MYKKLIILFAIFLYGYNDFYFYNIKMDYKEYSNGHVIDRDYSKFGDLIGIGYKYQKYFNIYTYYLNFEYANGSSYYDGSTWDGQPVFAKQNGVSILKLEGGIGSKTINLILGYRQWNRGKSNNPGDYEEIYYWPYWGIKYSYYFLFENFSFLPQISYLMAINPKLDVKLGDNPTIDLGYTNGASVEIPFIYKAGNLFIKLFYRYQYWHISRSNYQTIEIDNKIYEIYEPESITINQYLGIGLLYKF